MTHPAVLYFGILFQHHVGVYLLGCGKTLGLDDFKVNGDFLPVIVQKLVCCIAVNQRNSCQPCKDLPAQAFFLAGSIQLRYAVDECGLQVGIKVTESILEGGLECHYIRVVQTAFFRFCTFRWQYASLSGLNRAAFRCGNAVQYADRSCSSASGMPPNMEA